MYQSSFGQLLGTPAQRLIWPGGLMRHYVVGHVLVSFALDSKAEKSPEGFARSVGNQLRKPWSGLIGMRVLGSLLAALGFGALAAAAVRSGVPAVFAAAMSVVFSTSELMIGHAVMATPDAMAWGLFLIALTLAWSGTSVTRPALLAGGVGGLALGSKLTVLVIVPALVGVILSRSNNRWRDLFVCGLAIAAGAVIANPFFIADPFRVAKTLIGVTKFKDAEIVGWGGAMTNFFAGIPFWVIACGASAILMASLKRRWFLGGGLVISTLWLLSSAAGSRQVEPRYFVPLGLAYAFAGFVLIFPFIEVLPIRLRRLATIAATVGACCLLILSTIRQAQSDVNRINSTEPIQRAAQDLVALSSGRVLVDEDCFDTLLRAHVSSASFARAADEIEQRNLGGKGAARLASGHGASSLLLEVFGGLFDETGANHVARLRAMAASPGGNLNVSWFHPDAEHPGARLWPLAGNEAFDAFRSGDFEMLVIRGPAPAGLGRATEFRKPDGSVGFSVIRKVDKEGAGK